MDKDALHLKNSIAKDILKIKDLLGQSPKEAKKSIAQLQEDIRHQIVGKNWAKSVRLLILTDQFKKSISELCDTVQDLRENSSKLLIARVSQGEQSLKSLLFFKTSWRKGDELENRSIH